MEWTKIPTNLLNFDDKEILALVKYQLVWALAEEEPNTKMLKRYLTKKQLAIACGHHADVSLIVRRDIESVQKKRTKDNLRYKLAHNTNAKISPSETVGGSVGGSVGVPLSQIREEKIREDNITPLPPLKKGKEQLEFVSAEFKPIFQKWLDYKREKKQTYKGKLSLQQCYKQLLELSNNNVAIAEKVVNQSIANNWAGLFPLKDILKTTPKIDSPLQKAINNILEFMLANYEEKGISTNPTLKERYVKKWTPTITDLINACGGDLELAKKMIALYSNKQKGEEWYLWGVLNNFCSLYEELKRGHYVKK